MTVCFLSAPFKPFQECADGLQNFSIFSREKDAVELFLYTKFTGSQNVRFWAIQTLKTIDCINFLIIYADWSCCLSAFPPSNGYLFSFGYIQLKKARSETTVQKLDLEVVLEKRELVFETSNKGHVICKFDESQNGIVVKNVVCINGKENWRKNAKLGDSSI